MVVDRGTVHLLTLDVGRNMMGLSEQPAPPLGQYDLDDMECGACIVQTNRDPAKALPSLCSVLAQAGRLSEGANVVAAEIGQREMVY